MPLSRVACPAADVPRRPPGATPYAIGVACFCFVLAAPSSNGWTPGVGQPARSAANVLLIQADDLGYGDLSAYGQARFKTPSLERLAREGIQFTQYYAGSTV